MHIAITRLSVIAAITVASCLGVCASFAASASAQAPAPPLWQPSAEEQADLARVRSLHLGQNPAYTRLLDFSDPAQYRYFMTQLQHAGVSASRYPQLFRSIEETHQAHLARHRAGTPAADATCGNDQVCPLNTLTSFGAPTTNPLAFSVNALSSIPKTPPVAMNVIGLYDQNGKVFANPVTQMQHGTGYDVANFVSGNAPQGTTTVQAQGAWYYLPQGGGGVPGSFYAADAPGQNPDIRNTSPTNVKGNTQIKICVTRADTDCDYFYQAIGGQQVVRFPLIGSVTYPNPIQANGSGNPANAISSVTISQPTPGNGGACNPLPLNQNFNTIARVSNNVVNWSIDPAQFGVASPCFPTGTTVIFDLMLTVFDTSQKPWVIAVTSQQGQPQSNLQRIYPTVVVYGCVAEGTQITLADGSLEPIEMFRTGERIRSNSRNVALTVDNYTKGYEKPPMVDISTGNGRHLLLTEGHPVVTVAGLKLARQLAVGDVVETDAGNSKLVKVERRVFAGNVWNLDVGRPNDQVQITPTNTTFYANGILVGDGHIQGRMDRADYESPEQVLKRLDPKWRTDFLNRQADLKAPGSAQ